ncbi:alkaline shock response membrane anchor protein AmaP [Micromonospora sp. RHAY321]|uniref:alkaline shock response membrane anchor protein AmaP n=1 Tax=Micromonospora sp. RHAY321 TaxID=2944807 RepID=UPI00207C288D|nr:alkaline shock response membrane anchor protein AmaP [Micromonospora sp. RHAY321]MCO1594998.1 alkaline shock response membrane anchor protein AmaP [Micromonospora sp. RHAY321]
MSDAAHRLLWTIVALLLVLGGAAALVVSFGQVPGGDPDAALLGAGLRDAWRLAAPWSTLAAAVTGVLVALAGQRLLSRELRRPGEELRGTLSRRGHHPGRTRLSTEVLAHALERDLTGNPGVRRARVVLTGPPPRPDVWIRMDLTSDARATGVREHVHAAVRRFATTADCQPAHLDVTARIEPARP